MKIFGYIIGAILLIYLGLCFIGPKEIQASRSIEIDAPATAVYKHVGDLKNWKAWMPWYQNDPEMQLEWGEQTAGVGGHYAWSSENSGNGKMKIIEAAPGESMRTEIEFDGMGTSYGTWNFEPTEAGQTKVTWGMQAEDPVPFPMRGMLIAMGVQKQLDGDFDQGLASLKKVVEETQANLPTEYDGYQIKMLDLPASHYVGMREEIAQSDLSDFYAKNLPVAAKALTAAKSEMTGMPTGLFYSWDEKTGKTDVLAGIPVKTAPTALSDNMLSLSVPANKAVQINYYGEYDASIKAHMAMDKYLSDRNWKVVYPVMEEYVNDPTTVKDPSEILTKVTYMYTEG